MFNSFCLHRLKQARLLCPLLSPTVCSNSYALSHWWYPTIFSFSLQHFPTSGSSPRVDSLHEWPKYQSFNVSPSNEYSGFISFMNEQYWFACSLTNSQEYSSVPQFKSINSLGFNLLYGPALISVHDYHRNHSFD